MKFEKKYTIAKWTAWNSFLAHSIDDFYVVYSYYPNILEANRHTYSQIDFLVNVTPGERDRLVRKSDLLNWEVLPDADEEVGISTFKTSQCALDFAVNDKLPDKEFLLIYDSDPDWDHGEIPTDPVEEEKISVRVLV